MDLIGRGKRENLRFSLRYGKIPAVGLFMEGFENESGKGLHIMSRIEQLISEIEEYIDTCKYQALSNNTKIIVNKEELEELLVELKLRVPDEIKQYQKIISNQEAILNEARYQADNMIQEATAQTNDLVNEHEIMQRAYAAANQVVEDAQLQAQAIIDAAVNDANNIRQGAMQYTDDILRGLQNLMLSTMEGAQGRFDAFMGTLQSTCDVVTNNRNELARETNGEPTGEEMATGV